MPSKKSEDLESIEEAPSVESEEEISVALPKKPKREMTPEMLAKLAVAREKALEVKKSTYATKQKQKLLEQQKRQLESKHRADRVRELEAQIAGMQVKPVSKPVKKPRKVVVVQSSSDSSSEEEVVVRKPKYHSAPPSKQYVQPAQPVLPQYDDLSRQLFGRYS